MPDIIVDDLDDEIDDDLDNETPNTQEGGQTMADTTQTEYRVNLVQEEQRFTLDELVAGVDIKADAIVVKGEGDLKRGTLLMMSSEGGFIPATAEGINTMEACILCDDVTAPCDAAGYFTGTFAKSAIILPYETENDSHEELLEAIRPALRKQTIYLS